MSKEYFGKSGIRYSVPDGCLASGGEGKIYIVENYSCCVAKIYKEDRRTREREQKINVMIQCKLTDEQNKQITWPYDILYDEKGFAGYVMPLLENGKNLNIVMAQPYSEINYKHRVLIAHNICAVVDTIHEMNQICGDLNPQNICVNNDINSKDALNVFFVDTDSYHIVEEENVYRCEVGLANYIAPEIQKKMAQGYNLKTAPLPTYTRETDLFALAVHVFTLLMNGTHPFACAKDTENGYKNTMEQMNGTSYDSVVVPQPIDNIKEGFFPFVHSREGVTIPVYSLEFDALPHDIRELFVKTFVDGYNEPSKRATAKEWMDVLKKYILDNKFDKCTYGDIYFESASCPFCTMKERQKELYKKISGENGKKNISTENETEENVDEETETEKYDEEKTESKEISGSFIFWAIIIIAILFFTIYGINKNRNNNLNIHKPVSNQSNDNESNSETDTYIPETNDVGSVVQEEQVVTNDQYYYAFLNSVAEYVNAGDYYTAEAQCNQAISLFQECADAYMYLINLKIQQGDNKGALEIAKTGYNNVNDWCQCECCSNCYYEEDDLYDKKQQIKKLIKSEKIGLKIWNMMRNNEYKSAAKIAYNNEYDSNLKKKIYVKKGKIVDTIKKGKGMVYYSSGEFSGTVYKGEFKNGKPCGKGIEVGHAWSDSYYTISGTFKDGYANGYCSYYKSYNEFSDGKAYSSTILGNYKFGWENGSMQNKIYEFKNKKSRIYYFSSSMGTRKVKEVIDGEYVYAESSGGWTLYYKNKEGLKDNGVPNRKSKKKIN